MRTAIVPLLLIAIGPPAGANAQIFLPARSPAVITPEAVLRLRSGAFVIDTADQLRMHVDRARLAMSESTLGDTRKVRFHAEQMWRNVDMRLREIAQALGLPTPVERDAEERSELYRLQHMKAQAFDSAYARLISRGCDALLERMNRMSPQLHARQRFLIDDMLP